MTLIRAGLKREAKRRLRGVGDFVSETPPIKGEYLYGLHPVSLSLAYKSRTFNRLYVQDSLVNTSDSIKRVLKLAERAGIEEIQTKTKAQLNLVSENRPHQGVILDAEGIDLRYHTQYPDPHEMDDDQWGESGNRTPILIAPDMMTDPQNIGSLMRNAVYYGCAGVVVSNSMSTPLNGVVSKASAGALEVLAGQGRLIRCKSLPKFLTGCTEHGWHVFGTHVGEHGRSAEVVECTHPRLAEAFQSLERDARPPLVLVMGGEGEGLRPHTLRACSHTIHIPGVPVVSMEGFSSYGIDSLNVSVASGILLHALKSFPEA